MSSKLRIRIGEVEIDYEGTEDFLKQELPQLLKTAMELHKVAGQSLGGGDATKRGQTPASLKKGATTSTVAARLKSQSGPDLLVAAAAQLTFLSDKDTFTRQELLSSMQSATSYYKKSYYSNFAKYVTGAVGEGTLIETAANTYALAATSKEQLEKQLADA